MKTEPYDIVVSIVHYNTPDLLKRCLQAFRREGSPLRVKTVVIDNASRVPLRPEDVGEDVSLIVNERNRGFGAANNQAFRGWKARAYLVTNPDILPAQGSLGFLMKRLADNPSIGAVGARLDYPDGRFQQSCRRFPTLRSVLLRGFLSEERAARFASIQRYMMRGAVPDRPAPVDWILGSCLFLRREAVDQVSGFDERYFMYYEDIDLCYRLGRAGWTVEYNPDVRWVHDYRRESARGFRWRLRAVHFASALRFLLAHRRERGWRGSF